MKRKDLILFFSLFCIVLWSCEKSEVKKLEEQVQERLQSNDWKIRKQAIDLLLPMKKKAQQLSKKTGGLLIKALEEEVQRKRNFKEKATKEGKADVEINREFEQQYPIQDYGDYVVALAYLISDTRPNGSLPLLFQFLVDTKYIVSPVLPTLFGEQGLEYLINKASERSLEERRQAIQTLSLWVNPPEEAEDWDPTIIPPLSVQQKHSVLPVLIKALKDDDSYIVYCATGGLGTFKSQPEIKNKLEELSINGETEEIRSQARRILANESK